ncbi:carboxy terminal-processing peptidase [Agaribacterium haliotis]|uniref:carboxy terminal-processing peptidase n=1 Tax=Agaribacterium haliotis TaxID=2013869 RepID=UPI000BB54D05|nr:carboxy terminal-processing peptidase [Agaribacterium haliotis]
MRLSNIISPLLLSAALLGASAFAIPTKAPLSYSEEQSATAIELLYRLQQGHFNKQRMDDELSKDFLNKYLEMLDPSKMFFYEKDIQGFRKYDTKFDNFFAKGKLDVPYEIYAVYQQRVRSRLNNVIALLEDETVTFNFNGDDSIATERKDAPWIKTMGEADDLWHKRIKLSLLNLKMAGKSIDEARETLAKRYKNQLKRIDQEKSSDVFEIVLNALTVLFDPHTNYWSPRTNENFNINMSKSLEGIGAVLQSEDEFTKVVRLVTGGPASRQGQLKAADRIVGVGQGDDGEIIDVVGWRLDEVVNLIRGPKNTVVKLEVLPAGELIGAETSIVKISRDKVKLEDQAAQKAVLELPGDDGKIYKLGVIQLPDFYIDFDALMRRDPNYKSSTKDVARLISELELEGIDGLILDLRNNGGGSLTEATSLTDLFIDRGVVVQIKNSDGRVGRQNQAYSHPRYTGPLIVMINRLSASASEIVAGAIQDYGRGIIVGSRSFGKGTVQSVKELKLGHLKMTESKFYRVSGDSTQHRGVVPDISYPTLIDEEEVGESAYENALIWDQIRAVPHDVYNNYSPLIADLEKRHEKRVQGDPDFNYLLQRIDFVKRNRAEKSISLNEEKREQRKTSLEEESMQLENTRRLAKGLEPYKDLEAYRKEEESEEQEQDAGPPKIDIDGDTLLIESGNILVDLIETKYSKEQKIADNKNNPLNLSR